MYLITHVYNEEVLLPFWLKHHVPLFDGGVVIDYHSTDNSMDIVRELAPHWDIVTTENKFFDEPEISNEVMRVESQLSGWKMALNVTEFVLHDDLRGYTKTLEAIGRKGIRGNGVIMVDRPSERHLLEQEHLVLQKTFGYFERDFLDVLGSTPSTGYKERSRSRLLHRCSTGQYAPGRHTSRITETIRHDLFICWFGYAPMDHIIDRRLQIVGKSSEKMKREKTWMKYYGADKNGLETFYNNEHERSYDLLNDVTYKAAYDRFKENGPKFDSI